MANERKSGFRILEQKTVALRPVWMRKQNEKTDSGTYSINFFLRKLVGEPDAVSFSLIFQHFCREREMRILLTFCRRQRHFSNFLKIASKQDFKSREKNDSGAH